jgi:hypothetical protein
MSDELLLFMQSRDRPCCFRCLRQAFPLESADIRDGLEAARRAGAPIMIGEGRCAMCRQTTMVVAYIPGDPDLSRLAGD